MLQKYKDNPKVVIYAVCCDPMQFSNAEMDRAIAELETQRADPARFRCIWRRLQLGRAPTTFIINDKGIVQYCEGGLNPKYVESLQTKIDKVLGGRRDLSGADEAVS